MKFWPFGTESRAEEAVDGFTNQAVERAESMARGLDTAVKASETAVVEFGIGLYGRAFAAARVNPVIPALTPELLSSMARRLLLRGNAVFGLDVDRNGVLTLGGAATYDLTGGASPESWVYHLDYPGPSRFEKARLPSASVIHVRIGASESEPWRGISPLESAGYSSKAIANLELRLSQESGSRVGYLFAIPSGSDTSGLQQDLSRMAGGVGLIETTADGFGQGPQSAPKKDWELQRFGASIPQSNIMARGETAAHLLAALGVPAGMLGNSDGTHLRESYRQWLTSGVLPMARLVEAELTAKLERTITLDFSTLAAADIASRARAFGVLASNGIEVEEAKRLAGLSE